VEQAESHSKLPGGLPRWNPKAIRGVVGVSGVYNCFGLADHLHRRGLYRSLFDRIMSINGVPQLKLLSPIYCVKVTAALCSVWQRKKGKRGTSNRDGGGDSQSGVPHLLHQGYCHDLLHVNDQKGQPGGGGTISLVPNQSDCHWGKSGVMDSRRLGRAPILHPPCRT